MLWTSPKIRPPHHAPPKGRRRSRRSRYLEVTAVKSGSIELDKIILTGPEVAWAAEELEAQSFYLKKSEHPGWRLIAENLGDNVFDFDCRNICSFNCYLHPAMADLSRPVEVRINGRKMLCTPQPDHTLPDYTAKISVTVPEQD